MQPTTHHYPYSREEGGTQIFLIVETFNANITWQILNELCKFKSYTKLLHHEYFSWVKIMGESSPRCSLQLSGSHAGGQNIIHSSGLCNVLNSQIYMLDISSQ